MTTFDPIAANLASDRAAAAGIHVLNAFLLAQTEQGHAQRLLELMDPQQGAVVLDAGCGTGALAALMHAQRPDLTFKLLNLSAHQLEQCPQGMERIEADYTATGLPDQSVDVVLFAFSLCHAADWWPVLREARRVLREGGKLFVFDMVGQDVDNTLMWHLVKACAFPPRNIADLARAAGLELEEALLHQPAVERLREVFASDALYDAAFGKVMPATMRFVRRTEGGPIASAFARHRKVGFQFSGGRDSTAALYLLRPHWDRMELYHLDTGDQFPETRQVFAQVAAAFTAATGRPAQIIAGDVQRVRTEHGLASDVVPVDNTETGRLVSGRTVKIISRYECCWRSLMQPMHERMRADGITLIVRGQRDDEYATPPKRSGDVADGFEVLYPIENWSANEVERFVAQHQLPVAPFYQRGMKRAPECMGCTAWWDEGRAGYLRKHHPGAYETYAGRLAIIRSEIHRQLDWVEP